MGEGHSRHGGRRGKQSCAEDPAPGQPLQPSCGGRPGLFHVPADRRGGTGADRLFKGPITRSRYLQAFPDFFSS